MSATSAEFGSVVAAALRDFGEVLVLARMNRGAGRKDWYLLRQAGDLDAVVARNRSGDCLTAFPGAYLPFRGAAEDKFLPVALDLVMSVEESVFGELRDGDPELFDSFAAVPGDEGWVAEWFAERQGRQVVFGEYPPFLSDDPSIAIDGIVPQADGSVTRGIY
jgi:hypothetical protein